MSMVSRVDAESDGPELPSTFDFDEIERVFKVFDEEGDGMISATELQRCLMGLSMEWPQLYPERPWGEPCLSRTNRAEQIIGLQADRSLICVVEKMSLASSYYHNNFGNNVDYRYGHYNIRSMKHEASAYVDVLEHCIVDIPELGNMISCHDPEDYKRTNYFNWPGGLMGAVAEQAVAGVLANRIAAAGSDANNPWALHFMEIAVVLGLSFKLAGVALTGNRRPNLPVWMGKIGAVLTASAIIISLAMHLPPVMACTAAPLAFLVIAFAVAFA